MAWTANVEFVSQLGGGQAEVTVTLNDGSGQHQSRTYRVPDQASLVAQVNADISELSAAPVAIPLGPLTLA